MSNTNSHTLLEDQITEWRTYLRRHQAIHATDVAELEDHLREQIQQLTDSGLQSDEAFLVAVKRLGKLDVLSREFAREHSDRLWKQLVLDRADSDQPQVMRKNEPLIAIALAVLAAILIKIPAAFGVDFDGDAGFYIRNLSILVLPVLAGYLIWKRQLGKKTMLLAGAAFTVAAVVVNAYPFTDGGATEILTALHMPIALWFIIGLTYAGERWRGSAGRMDFIRYTGEQFIYYVLIALGGGVLTGFTLMLFESIGLKAEYFVSMWLIPCGAAGAVIISAWLVEAKQNVIENMAPVLTRLFTPLFALALLTFLGTIVWTGNAIDISREILIGFDLLLVAVLGLLIYSISAREASAAPNAFDILQVILVVSGFLADAVALWAILSRISEFGFTPNRVAGLGINIILLGNLIWSTILYIQFLRRKKSFAELERWQTNYLIVYAVWAAAVVILFPPIFHFK